MESFFRTLGFSAMDSAGFLDVGSVLLFLRSDFPFDLGELGGDTLL